MALKGRCCGLSPEHRPPRIQPFAHRAERLPQTGPTRCVGSPGRYSSTASYSALLTDGFLCGGMSPVHCELFNIIPPAVMTKNVSRHCQTPPGGQRVCKNHPCLRTTGLDNGRGKKSRVKLILPLVLELLSHWLLSFISVSLQSQRGDGQTVNLCAKHGTKCFT